MLAPFPMPPVSGRVGGTGLMRLLSSVSSY